MNLQGIVCTCNSTSENKIIYYQQHVFVLQANLGNMDEKKEQWKMIGGNMALTQVCMLSPL